MGEPTEADNEQGGEDTQDVRLDADPGTEEFDRAQEAVMRTGAAEAATEGPR